MRRDRKSTRLNSSHTIISYAVFCLKKKNEPREQGRYRVLRAAGGGERRAGPAAPAGGRPPRHRVRRYTPYTPESSFFFFLNDAPPPEFSPFPLPPALPI